MTELLLVVAGLLGGFLVRGLWWRYSGLILLRVPERFVASFQDVVDRQKRMAAFGRLALNPDFEIFIQDMVEEFVWMDVPGPGKQKAVPDADSSQWRDGAAYCAKSSYLKVKLAGQMLAKKAEAKEHVRGNERNGRSGR